MPDLTPALLRRKADAAEREAARMDAFETKQKAKAAEAARLAASLRRNAKALRAGAEAMEAANRAPPLRIAKGMESAEQPHRGRGRPVERRSKLRDAMDAAGLSAAVLAKQIKRSPVTVMTWMGNFRQPPKNVQDQIRALLPSLPADAFDA